MTERSTKALATKLIYAALTDLKWCGRFSANGWHTPRQAPSCGRERSGR